MQGRQREREYTQREYKIGKSGNWQKQKEKKDQKTGKNILKQICQKK